MAISSMPKAMPPPPRQAYHHDDHHRNSHAYGNQDYAYGAPPIVYAPQESPGISLFLPL
jgi:hypothetical protein